jgi:hypothetical protein
MFTGILFERPGEGSNSEFELDINTFFGANTKFPLPSLLRLNPSHTSNLPTALSELDSNKHPAATSEPFQPENCFGTERPFSNRKAIFASIVNTV